MFTITNNFEIHITRGDDSGAIPLILNTGTSTEPSEYLFSEDLYIGGQTSLLFEIALNKTIFKAKCPSAGLYSFYYLHGQWYLNSTTAVNLNDYGITCTGELENEDAFSIIQMDQNNSIVRFYILEANTPLDDWLVRKTFYRNGTVISEYANQIPLKEVYTSNIDSNGYFLIRLVGDDTNWLDAGEYNYIVQIELKNKVTNKVVTSTVVNRRPFYIIDDDFDRQWE